MTVTEKKNIQKDFLGLIVFFCFPFYSFAAGSY